MKPIAKHTFRVAICIATVLAITTVRFAIHSEQSRLLSEFLDLFLIAVLVTSIRWGTGYAIFLSLLSAFAFSWSLPPPGHFHLGDPRVWTLLTTCLVAGIVAGQLSALARRETLAAERRQAEAVAAQLQFADLVNSVDGIVWEADAETFAFSFVSEQAEQILGYPAARWLREPTFWKDHLHPEDRDWAPRFCRQAVTEKRSHDFEYRMIAADGRVVWLRDLVSVVVEDGRATRLRGVMVDVTKRKHAEDAARRSEKELRDVVNTVPAAVWRTSPDGSVDFVNERWLKFTGLPREDALGQNWETEIHPDDRSRLDADWRAAVENGHAMETEGRVRRADGEYRWSFIRNVPVRDELGNIVKWYGTGIDIEDRKRAESLLAGEKRILEMVAKGDALSDILDALCRIVEGQASGVLASILLLDGDRLRHGGAPSLPKAYTDAINGAVIGPSAGSCGTAAYRGQQVIVEDIATDALWADYRDLALPHSLHACWSTPVFSSQRKVIATFAMYYREPRSPSPRDQEIIEQITNLAGVAIERKLTQEALRRSEAYLAESQRLTHTGSWARDGSTYKVLYWSDETFRILGLEPKRGVPESEYTLRNIHPEDRDRVDELRKKAMREKSDFATDYRIVLPDGTLKHLHVIGHPVLDETGEALEFVGTVVDVTDRRRAEEEREKLRQLEADLAHMNRVSMMGELTASLAHEMNQPIAAAITNANTCLRWLSRNQPDLEEAQAAAMRIVKDGTRAAEIINRLRSFYKKGAQSERELVDVSEVIREMTVLLRNEAARRSISIHLELAQGIPKAMADRVQLQQVLMNLMLNAIEAMHETAGELTIKSQLDGDGQLLISVSDTGVGLPAEKGDQIFDAFVTTKSQGTGMGLAITRSIIEAHGGRLWATGNPRRGATFQFTLPDAEAAQG